MWCNGQTKTHWWYWLDFWNHFEEDLYVKHYSHGLRSRTNDITTGFVCKTKFAENSTQINGVKSFPRIDFIISSWVFRYIIFLIYQMLFTIFLEQQLLSIGIVCDLFMFVCATDPNFTKPHEEFHGILLTKYMIIYF